jgi:uroporphyrinogen decarboxylase
MEGFENLRRAFFCQGEPACVPALEYTVDKAIQEAFLGREPRGIDDRAAFFLGAGYDFVPIDLGMPRLLFQHAGEGAAGARVWARSGDAMIAGESPLYSDHWPEADNEPYEDITQLGKILPAEAKVIPLLGYVFAGTWMLMGFEPFCLDLANGGHTATAMIDRIGRFHYQVVKNLLQFECVGAICMPDDFAYKSGLMVKPSFLREYVFPWHKRIGALVRAKGLPYLFHSDGNYAAVIDDLVECGYNAIHPCEPASFDMAELKRQYGGRLCLCGNIDLDSTLTLGTPEEVDREVRLRIRTVGPGGGYCCGSSNSVTEYVPMENYRAMLAATKKYGRYPIRLN